MFDWRPETVIGNIEVEERAAHKDSGGMNLLIERVLAIDEHDAQAFAGEQAGALKTGESGAQTSGMVQAVKAGEGTIGYADESQAGDLGVAKVKVGNTYVAPSAAGATADFDQSQKDPELSQGQNVFAYTVQRTPTDPSSYPVLLVSYLMGCTKYDSTETTDLVKAYFTFIVGDEGQQLAAQNAGSAPIGSNIKKEDQNAINAIGS